MMLYSPHDVVLSRTFICQLNLYINVFIVFFRIDLPYRVMKESVTLEIS